MHMLLENHLAALGALVRDRMVAGFGGMSPSAAAVLLTLANRGPMAVSELAAILGVAQPTASRLLDGLAGGLARNGLVARRDKRGRRVTVAAPRAPARSRPRPPAASRPPARFAQPRHAPVRRPRP